MEDLIRGLAVMSSDGKTLGTVDEIRPDHFKVDAPHAFDYWLERSCVKSVGDEGVVVSFAAARLEEYRRTDPGAGPGVKPASALQQAYIPGARPEDANVHFDPKTAPDAKPTTPAR
jgi:hypothetical protein